MPQFPFAPAKSALIVSAFLCFGASMASATTYTYDLTTSFADTHGSGVDLTPTGGTLTPATGYSWGIADPNEGLTLNNVIGANAAYTIEMKFSFDTTTSWRRIIDFKNRQSDNGLYNLDTAVQLFPNFQGPPGAFADGTPVDLLLTRTATGLVTVSVDGNLQITNDDSVSQFASFDGSSIIFFMDNTGAFGNEVSGGLATFIEINTPTSPTPLPAALPLFATGLGAMGLLGWRRKRKASAAIAV